MSPGWVIWVTVKAKGSEAESFSVLDYFISFAGGGRVELFIECFVGLYMLLFLFSLGDAAGWSFIYFLGGGVHLFCGGVHLGCVHRMVFVYLHLRPFLSVCALAGLRDQ